MRLFQVDSFTQTLFAGNPAGVCLLDAPRSEAWMRSVAAEMNLSETAFLTGEKSRYHLRWFTPEVEVPLCGHATLATAHVLWEQGLEDPAHAITFLTLSGELTARRRETKIELDFPASEVAAQTLPPELLRALALPKDPVFCGVKTDSGVAFVEVADEATVRDLSPDLNALKLLPYRGAIVTSRGRAHAEYDFISRFFAPRIGIPEDPVTGAAHCALAPYWKNRLGKDSLVGYQASARGGFVGVSPRDGRVLLSGEAVTVFEAQLPAGGWPNF